MIESGYQWSCSPATPGPRPDNTCLDVLDDNAKRSEVLDTIDRDELTGDLVGQEAALLDVTTPVGLDDLSTVVMPLTACAACSSTLMGAGASSRSRPRQ